MTEISAALVKDFVEDRQQVRRKAGIHAAKHVARSKSKKVGLKGTVTAFHQIKRVVASPDNDSSGSSDNSSDSDQEVLRKPKGLRRHQSISFYIILCYLP